MSSAEDEAAQAGECRALRLTTALAFLVMLPSGWCAVCSGPTQLEARLHAHPDIQAYAALGDWYGDRRRFDCAAEAFRSALKLDPTSGPLEYMVGLSLYSEGQAEQAIAPLQRSVKLAPGLLKAHLLLAATLEQLRRHDEARAEWEAAIKLDPNSPIALDGLSKSLMAGGDYSSVVNNLKPFPHDENLTLDLALAYGKMGMLDESAATLTEALKVNPNSARLNKALITVMVQQTRYQDAARIAEKSARLHPGDLEAEADYLRVLVLNGDTAIARPLASKLLATAPHNFDFLYLSGILERQAGEYAIARTHLEEAVALNPDYYNTHYNLGAVLAKLGDAQGARKQFEEAIALGATESEVNFDLAGVLRTLGETQAAQEQLKIYQRKLKDKADRTQAATKSAQAAQELATGDPRKAVALYQEAYDAMPTNAMIGYRLALAMDKAGDTATERDVLEKVIKIDPSMAIAQNQLGYLESRGGDPASAEEHFKLAVRAAPGYTDAWVSLAATLGMESRFPEAQQALTSALRLDPQNTQANELRKALAAAEAGR